jgi:putative ABC transport system ATP-binding protein
VARPVGRVRYGPAGTRRAVGHEPFRIPWVWHPESDGKVLTVTATPQTQRNDQALLVVDRVSKTHGTGIAAVPAVRAVSLRVDAGELVAVTGPSGCGKSTLLTLAGGLDRVDSGTVTVAGADLAALPERELFAHRRRHIGYVFQDYNLISTLTALENVALPAELDGVRLRTARQDALTALEAVGIAGLAGRFPHQLSGGQQQRVAIARALGGGRRLLLADEPTGALDSATAQDVLKVIADRVRAGAGAVVVTHDPAVAESADRVVRMLDGAAETTSRVGG